LRRCLKIELAVVDIQVGDYVL